MWKTWIKEVLTGKDNQTLAVGRILGATLFLIFLVAVPGVALVVYLKKAVAPDDLVKTFTVLTTYVPAIGLSVAGLIGLTAMSEPPKQ